MAKPKKEEKQPISPLPPPPNFFTKNVAPSSYIDISKVREMLNTQTPPTTQTTTINKPPVSSTLPIQGSQDLQNTANVALGAERLGLSQTPQQVAAQAGNLSPQMAAGLQNFLKPPTTQAAPIGSMQNPITVSMGGTLPPGTNLNAAVRVDSGGGNTSIISAGEYMRDVFGYRGSVNTLSQINEPADQNFTNAAQPGGSGATPGLDKTFMGQVTSIPPDVPGAIGGAGDIGNILPPAFQPGAGVSIDGEKFGFTGQPTPKVRGEVGGFSQAELNVERALKGFDFSKFGLEGDIEDILTRGKKKQKEEFGKIKGKKVEDLGSLQLELNAFLKDKGFQAVVKGKGKDARISFSPIATPLQGVAGGPGGIVPPGTIPPGAGTGAPGQQPDEPGTTTPPTSVGTEPPIDTGPALLGDPATAVGMSMGAVQEKAQFVQNILNTLGKPLMEAQLEQFQTFTKAQNELRSSIAGFRQESPEAVAKREAAVQGFLDRGYRELNRQLGSNLRSRMNELRSSGFASSNLAAHVLEETALRTVQQGTDDLLDRADQYDLQVREQQSQQRSRELAGLTGIQGPSFPTNIPEVQFPPLGAFAPPTTFRDKLEALKFAYILATDVPGRTREEKAKLIEMIMSNTTQVMDSSGAGVIGALGGFLGGVAGGMFGGPAGAVAGSAAGSSIGS